jgi:hypothetical protein
MRFSFGAESMDFSAPGTPTESERLLLIQPKIPSELRRLCSMSPWDVAGRPETVAAPGRSASLDIVNDWGSPRDLGAGSGSSLLIGGLEGYRSVEAGII